jgi:hypothetical protein
VLRDGVVAAIAASITSIDDSVTRNQFRSCSRRWALDCQTSSAIARALSCCGAVAQICGVKASELVPTIVMRHLPLHS